jgi:hypothetical protein
MKNVNTNLLENNWPITFLGNLNLSEAIIILKNQRTMEVFRIYHENWP